MKGRKELFTREFFVLNFIIFLTFCNIAVFFQLNGYLLDTLHVTQQQAGFLIGVFALTALILRPFISPFFMPGNARKWILIGTIGVIVSLFFYQTGKGFSGMMAIRIVHGFFYVIMATAVMARIVSCIPIQRSAEAFGIISVITLLPYAVLPPLIHPLVNYFGGFIRVLDVTALFMLPIPLLLLLVPPIHAEDAEQKDKLTFTELKNNIKNKKVLRILVVSLFVFIAFTPVFYFIRGFAKSIGIVNAGWFFTISTLLEIFVRLVGGRYLDRGNKPMTLFYSLFLLLFGYLLLAHTRSHSLFFIIAILFGLGWGVALPLLNGLLFDYSDPRLRALNVNLGLEMFQGGFFLGPLLGGFLLASWNYQALYYACGGLILIAIALLTPLLAHKKDQTGAPI
jgi:predicted MFS family arabinose efflux permease